MATLRIDNSQVHIESLQLQYREVLDRVLASSEYTKPRGMATYEVSPMTLVILHPELPQLPVETGRKVSLDIAMIEAIQLIAGRSATDLLLRIAPQFERYSNVDQLGRRYFHGNYGKRMNAGWGHDCTDDTRGCTSLLDCAVTKIKNDRDTRQAAITIWDNSLDNGVTGMNDYPCTVAMIFKMYRGRLDMHVTMRSNDVWRGLPYDIFQFTQAQQTVANMLCAPVGRYFHTTTSMHFYEEDVNSVFNVENRDTFSNVTLPRGFSNTLNAWSILTGHTSPADQYTTSERWYLDRLTPFFKEEMKTDDV